MSVASQHGRVTRLDVHELVRELNGALGPTLVAAATGSKAAALGLTLEEFLAEVAADWGERSFMQTGTLPRSWRDDRATLVIEHPTEGWLVDVEHPDSISALESSLRTHLLVGGYSAFTTAALRGDDRALTTAVADIVHDARLDDGSRPLAIHFRSKHGGSWCRALWLDHGSDSDMGSDDLRLCMRPSEPRRSTRRPERDLHQRCTTGTPRNKKTPA
jgi:hypothetical protein